MSFAHLLNPLANLRADGNCKYWQFHSQSMKDTLVIVCAIRNRRYYPAPTKNSYNCRYTSALSLVLPWLSVPVLSLDRA